MSVPVITLLSLSSAMASEEKDVQDMSDPLAVYTQVGGGLTDKGANFKFGQTYDTGSDVITQIRYGMNIRNVYPCTTNRAHSPEALGLPGTEGC